MNKRNFRVAEGLEEGVHYTIFKDGFDVEYPVAIASHETFMPRTSGIVYIEALRISVNEGRTEERGRRDDIETRSAFKQVKDKATGLYFGIPLGVDPQDKTIKWKRIPLSPRQPYNLSDPKDREMWAMISRMPNLLGSPNQAGKPLYKVIDEDQKSKNFLATYDLRKNATEIVEGLDDAQQREMAINVGINADAFSRIMLRAELLQYADKNAQKFLDVWNDPKKPIISAFNRANKYGIIKFNSNGNGAGKDIGYYYDRVFLGNNEAVVIARLGEPAMASTLSSIAMMTAAQEKAVQDGLNHKVEASKKVMNKDQGGAAPDPEKEAMRKELEELKAKLAGVAPTLPGTQTVDLGTANAGTASVTSSAVTPKDDLAALRAEAKALKIPRWHILGEDKLRAAIAEKKAQPVS